MGGSLTSNPVSAYVVREFKPVRTPIVPVDRLLAWQGGLRWSYRVITKRVAAVTLFSCLHIPQN